MMIYVFKERFWCRCERGDVFRCDAEKDDIIYYDDIRFHFSLWCHKMALIRKIYYDKMRKILLLLFSTYAWYIFIRFFIFIAFRCCHYYILFFDILPLATILLLFSHYYRHYATIIFPCDAIYYAAIYYFYWYYCHYERYYYFSPPYFLHYAFLSFTICHTLFAAPYMPPHYYYDGKDAASLLLDY